MLQKSGSDSLMDITPQSGLTRIFDIDPSLNIVSKDDQDESSTEEHLHLAKYLKERVLTLDIWNAESLMHFGTCKVPLNAFMRQGEPSKVVAQEYDICEADFGQYIGGLQLLVTNEGRKIPPREKTAQPIGGGHKHKKKVHSKPIDNVTSLMDLSSKTQPNLAMMYETTKQNQSTLLHSEEARKKLRVDRLKRHTAQIDMQQNSTSMA